MLDKDLLSEFELIGCEINFSEIGARGKVKDFGLFERVFNYVGFEPDSDAASIKQNLLQKRSFKSVSVINEAVGRGDDAELNVTLHEGCSSLYTPNFDVTDNYRGYRVNDHKRPFSDNFKIKKRLSVSVKPLNNFIDQFSSNCIDVVQIDTQGGELEILKDFDYISNVTAIDIEMGFVELYKSQTLFEDVYTDLKSKGFTLVRVFNMQCAPRYPCSEYNQIDNGDLVSMDGIFLRFPEKGAEFTPGNVVSTIKFIVISYVYGFYGTALEYCDRGLDCETDHEVGNMLRLLKSFIQISYNRKNRLPKFFRKLSFISQSVVAKLKALVGL